MLEPHRRRPIAAPPPGERARSADAARPDIAAVAARAEAAGRLSAAEARELVALFGTPPGGECSGLDESDARRFVEATYQAIETCIAGPAPSRCSFINILVQRELDRIAGEEGLDEAVLENICDVHRRGTDRRYTFGQVKERPDDPEDPSFFGGLWPVRCGDSMRKVLFSIHADAVADSIVVRPHAGRGEGARALGAHVRARGPHPWALQVEKESPLGAWIRALCGTDQIGQLRGHFPLGVLGEAVERALAARGVTHLLLGASRRDPPTRPWHTGAFLRPLGTMGDFAWSGVGIDGETDLLVDTECTVRTRAKIHRLEAMR